MNKNLADAIARSIIALLPDALDLADRDYTYADFRIDFPSIIDDDARLADAFESFLDNDSFDALAPLLESLDALLPLTSAAAMTAALDARYLD